MPKTCAFSPALLALLLSLVGCGDAPGGDDASVDVVTLDSSTVPDTSASDASDADATVDMGVDATIATDAGPVGVDAGQPEDPTRNGDEEILALIDPYEAQFWGALDAFEERVRGSMLDGPYTDASAREATYSSSIGHGVYHAQDDLVALSHVMEATAERAHKERYAEVAAGVLDIIIPAVAEGQGTEGCPNESSIYRCSPGKFRYLDAAHGLGAAGFLMNAIYEDPGLRAMYDDELQRWAEEMVPELDRLDSVVTEAALTTRDITLRNPHMPCKIAAGYLAVGKILGREDYLDAFQRVAEFMLRAIDHNAPAEWVGSDVSHAVISTSVIFAAYREQLRGVLPLIIRNEHLRGIGETFEEARNRYDYSHGGERDYDVGSHAVTVQLSPAIADLVVDDYDVPPTGRVGAVARGWRYATLGALAIGYATRIQEE